VGAMLLQGADGDDEPGIPGEVSAHLRPAQVSQRV